MVSLSKRPSVTGSNKKNNAKKPTPATPVKNTAKKPGNSNSTTNKKKK